MYGDDETARANWRALRALSALATSLAKALPCPSRARMAVPYGATMLSIRALHTSSVRGRGVATAFSSSRASTSPVSSSSPPSTSLPSPPSKGCLGDGRGVGERPCSISHARIASRSASEGTRRLSRGAKSEKKTRCQQHANVTYARADAFATRPRCAPHLQLCCRRTPPLTPMWLYALRSVRHAHRNRITLCSTSPVAVRRRLAHGSGRRRPRERQQAARRGRLDDREAHEGAGVGVAPEADDRVRVLVGREQQLLARPRQLDVARRVGGPACLVRPSEVRRLAARRAPHHGHLGAALLGPQRHDDVGAAHRGIDVPAVAARDDGRREGGGRRRVGRRLLALLGRTRAARAARARAAVGGEQRHALLQLGRLVGVQAEHEQRVVELAHAVGVRAVGRGGEVARPRPRGRGEAADEAQLRGARARRVLRHGVRPEVGHEHVLLGLALGRHG
eukprot:scaffold27699_cov63-Phaeocystis_antarctica.AAC.6